MLPKALRLVVLMSCVAVLGLPADAQPQQDRGSRLKRLEQIRETQRENRATQVSEESLGAVTANIRQDAFGRRDMLVYLPSHLPPKGERSLLVALHGGGGNAQFMLDHLKIDGVAEKNGFIVAYLNGSAATRIGGRKLKAWNAGKGCCGKPYEDQVDDVAYITGAVRYLQKKYGVDPARTFGVGHSNGAIMTQTLACVSNLYTRVATLAGTLMAETPNCPSARGHTIFNYHGTEDVNLPVAGGHGSKGVTHLDFTSQEQARALFESSGGRYVLQLYRATDHSIEHLSAASQRQDGISIAERIARDLGLLTRR